MLRSPRTSEASLTDLAINPYPILARLRVSAPVVWVEDANMWFITRRDDVLRVLRDPDTFRTDAPHSTIRDTFGEHMLTAEGDAHRRYKSHCNPPFNTRAVRDRTIPLINAYVRELFDAWGDRTVVDLRPALASPLAIYTVGSVLGIPVHFHDAIRRWYDDFAAALANFAWDDQVRARGRRSVQEFKVAVQPLIGDLSRSGDPSLLATLGREQADRLTDDEIFANTLIVLFGGIETTESTVLNVIWSLLRHPDTLAEIRQEPTLLPAAIDESMRWEPAVQSCTRFVGTPVRLRGVSLAKDDVVQCMLGAANRDPEFFADPDRYDIRRHNAADHLSFGSGKHFCLGAALARAEVQVAVEGLLARYPNLRADPDRPSSPYGYEFRAPPSLHVLLGRD